MAGVRLLARINNAGVFAELVGVVLLIGLLFAHARRGPGILLETLGHGGGGALGLSRAGLAASLMASYVLYGFDTAGTLAEETSRPRRRAPRAILQALAAAAHGRRAADRLGDPGGRATRPDPSWGRSSAACR